MIKNRFVFHCEICDCDFNGVQTHLYHKHSLTSKQYYDQYLKKNGDGVCIICGNETQFYRISMGGYLKHCIHCVSKDKRVKIKKEETCLNHFGVSNPMKHSDIKDVYKKNNLANHGYEWPMQRSEIQEKSKNTCLIKYKKSRYSETDQFKKHLRIITINRIEKQNLNGEPMVPCIGHLERECLNELQNHTQHVIIRNPKIIGYFPDGYIRDLNLVIEFDENFHDRQVDEDYERELNLASCGNLIFRIKQKDWEQNKIEIIEKFQILIEETSWLKLKMKL